MFWGKRKLSEADRMAISIAARLNRDEPGWYFFYPDRGDPAAQYLCFGGNRLGNCEEWLVCWIGRFGILPIDIRTRSSSYRDTYISGSEIRSKYAKALKEAVDGFGKRRSYELATGHKKRLIL